MDTWIDKFSSKFGGFMKKKTPLVELLPTMLNPEDPRVGIRSLGNDWICPFSGARIETPTWDGAPDNLLNCQEIVEFLLALPMLQKTPEKAVLKTFEELAERAVCFRLQHFPNYRQCSDKGEWVCPYCLHKTPVTLTQWDGTDEPPEVFVPHALGHLKTCEVYKAAPLDGKSVEQIRDSFGDDALRIDLTKRVNTDPRFNIYDDNGMWICPFSTHPIDTIRKPVSAGQGIDIKGIIRHLMDPKVCPAHYSKWNAEATLEELNRVAGRYSEQRQHAIRESAAETELAQLRQQHAHAASVMTEIQHELEAARKAQIKMLPERPPEVSGYEVAALYESCVELSGDLYHFLDPGPGMTGFVVGDVSGHGVEAAMVMSAALKSFSVRSKGIESPATVLTAVNEDLYKDVRRGRFVTAFYVVLEHATGQITFSRAGHNPILLVVPNQEIQLLSGGEGLALGITADHRWSRAISESQTILPPQSMVVLYTDGVVEAMSPEREEFGLEQLCLLLQQYAALPAAEIIENIRVAVMQHVGNQPTSDDVTLVILKRS